MRAIEKDFPFEAVDVIAELESWRKEVSRPNYHIHKWWANRLGSVFRAIILGTMLDSEQDIWEHFYQKNSFSGRIILDPFMGSGTTIGESIKLGIKAIGGDINPISTFIVRQSLTGISESDLIQTFNDIEQDVKYTISRYYKTINPNTNKICDALYYFWVKVVTTESGEEIPLFSNYVFSKNAYPQKKPLSKIVCPNCWSILDGLYNSESIVCSNCAEEFNPQVGTAQGKMVVGKDGQKYKIKEIVSKSTEPPKHRLFAIMALDHNGEKIYLKPTDFDFDLYREAVRDLQKMNLPLPTMSVRKGYNTDQARGYNYRYWHQFFNERQLLALGLLLKRILQIEDLKIKEHFLCLFSGTLEFNNMFCSFKGEGTGAVRHMFSHHIFKPERVPLENNVWGTNKSSGSFSTLFRSRLLRSKEYLRQPFELLADINGKYSSRKVVCSSPIDTIPVDSFSDFVAQENRTLILNGNSAELPIPNESVDAVVTDPPYFDFVHYSELSDFFYAWLKPVLHREYTYFSRDNSSDLGEVQDKDPDEFSASLGRVFRECYRVLKDDGLLVFSFHHSRPEAWLAIYRAITESGLDIVAAHPVKAEMSISNPKNQSNEPINIDAIMVCKKRILHKPISKTDILNAVYLHSQKYIDRFTRINRELSNADIRVIRASQALVHCSLSGQTIKSTASYLRKIFHKQEDIFLQTEMFTPEEAA